MQARLVLQDYILLYPNSYILTSRIPEYFAGNQSVFIVATTVISHCHQLASMREGNACMFVWCLEEAEVFVGAMPLTSCSVCETEHWPWCRCKQPT